MDIVDSHHHFWDPATRAYPWLTAALEPINRRFNIDDLRPSLREAGVSATILVQTVSSLSETREFLAVAGSNNEIEGVVGWVDLTRPTASDQLAELALQPGGTKLVGIRHQVHDEPDPAWLLRADVQQGIARVGEAGLIYEFLVRPRELEAAFRTAVAHPDTSFVIDHMGKPNIASGETAQWEKGMSPFAELDNVSCKISGLTTEARWQTWRADEFKPYVARVLEWFGEHRLLFGSDWPVCLLSGTYQQTLDAYLTAVEDIAPNTVESIFQTNASRIYGLDATNVE